MSKTSKSNDLDSYVRHLFDLDPPKVIKYIKGWGDTDWLWGECSDKKAWMIEIEYVYDKKGREYLQLVTIRLRPGVSQREARKAAERAVGLFNRKQKGGRPGIRIQERDLLKAVFQTVASYAARPVRPTEVVRLATEVLKHIGSPISIKTIYREYRQWRVSTGHHVRHYCSEKRKATVHT